MVWHHHDTKTNYFDFESVFIMDFRDKTVEVHPGEF